MPACAQAPRRVGLAFFASNFRLLAESFEGVSTGARVWVTPLALRWAVNRAGSENSATVRVAG
jgi:hypothetical protein